MSRKTIVPVLVILLIFGAYIVISTLLGRFKYNDASAVGNTAGNLYNKGLFAECGGHVYFSNRNDSGALYSMNPDESSYRKLVAANVAYINADENHVYYFQDSNIAAAGDLSFVGNMIGIYRVNRNGEHAECLNRNPACMLTLIGNSIYFENIDDKKGAVLYKVRIDKKDPAQELTDYIADCSSVMNQCFYYAGMQKDHNLYVWDTRTDTSSLLMEGSVWNPTATADGIYFVNVADGYRLYKCGLDGSSPVKLTDDRVDTYNVAGNMIYYQKNSADSPALMRMGTDGSNPETVRSGNYCNINSTSQYIYFLQFGSDSPFYQTPVNGAVDVTAFDPEVVEK